jgi:hypothetical protein
MYYAELEVADPNGYKHTKMDDFAKIRAINHKFAGCSVYGLAVINFETQVLDIKI